MTRGHGALVLAMAACVSGNDHEHPNYVPDASQAGDASTDAAALRDICDGSEELRFALRLIGGSSQLTPSMMTGIGFSYLYVTGDCRYWVNPAVFYEWEETRTGTLSRAQEQALSRAFNYAAWKELAGYHLGNAGGLPAGLLQVFDGENLIECDNSCISYGTSLGQTLDSFSEGFKRWSKDLWEVGAPSEPTLRSVGERFELTEPLMDHVREVMIQWPFAWSIDDLVVADREGPGQLLVDEARVRELRALRAMYVGKGPLPDGKPNPFLRVDHFSFLVGDDESKSYSLWFRDALPFETADGMIPFPTGGHEP